MIAVDTNLVVRFLVRDDEKQAARAASLIRANEVWISKTVLLETEWVLRSLYGFSTEKLVGSLRSLAGLPTVFLEDESVAAKALEWSQEGLDFADALHVSSAISADEFATFDEELARKVRRLAAMQVISL